MLILFGSRSSRHVVNLQVFKDERAILVHQLARLLVQEITARVSHLARHTSQFFLGTSASVASFLATVNLAVRLLDLRFCSTRETRIGYFLSRGEDGKGLDSQVNTYRLGT